jgi:hypothetical protein
MSASNIIPCECGGTTNTLPCLRDKHRLTPQHQTWMAENPDKLRIMPKTVYKYTCVCGNKLTQKHKKNISIHERTKKHQNFINKDSKNEPILS